MHNITNVQSNWKSARSANERANMYVYMYMLCDNVFIISVVKYGAPSHGVGDRYISVREAHAYCETLWNTRQIHTWLADNQIRFLDWPPQPPDPVYIENVWHILGKSIQRHKRSSKLELKERILREWSLHPRKFDLNALQLYPKE